jgi:hypothetical protein
MRWLTSCIQSPLDDEVLRRRYPHDGTASLVANGCYQPVHLSVVYVAMFLYEYVGRR